MNRGQLQARIDRAWTRFSASYAGLAQGSLVKPGVTGSWSVKDIIAHVTTWEEEALEHLPLIARGGRPPRYFTAHGGIDEFNAKQTERNRRRTLNEVLQRATEVHERLVGFVDGVPEELFATETRFRRRLRWDTYGHYPRHAEAIERWRERTTAGELR